MTDVAALIADMVRADVDPDIIGRTAAALSERDAVLGTDVLTPTRSAGALRQARYRERKAERPVVCIAPKQTAKEWGR